MNLLIALGVIYLIMVVWIIIELVRAPNWTEKE